MRKLYMYLIYTIILAHAHAGVVKMGKKDYILDIKDYARPDQVIIPRIGAKGVYLEPTDHIITKKGIVYKRNSW